MCLSRCHRSKERINEFKYRHDIKGENGRELRWLSHFRLSKRYTESITNMWLT
jgi:hypothetical protein